MSDLLKRNLVLFAIFIAFLLIFFTMTLPAMERNRKLAAIEVERMEELQRLHLEEVRMETEIRAVELRDPGVLERAVRSRFSNGDANRDIQDR